MASLSLSTLKLRSGDADAVQVIGVDGGARDCAARHLAVPAVQVDEIHSGLVMGEPRPSDADVQ